MLYEVITTILSRFGYFFPFSISFKYDLDKPVILAKPNKDKFLSVRICFNFRPKINRMYSVITSYSIHYTKLYDVTVMLPVSPQKVGLIYVAKGVEDNSGFMVTGELYDSHPMAVFILTL